jgi:hypothetical protein
LTSAAPSSLAPLSTLSTLANATLLLAPADLNCVLPF